MKKRLLLWLVPWGLTLAAPNPPRARDLGIPFDGVPGALNAITDLPGVEVGQVTLIAEGNGGSGPGHGPVRTGVTAIFPRGRHDDNFIFGGWFALNGNGELTGMNYLHELGFLVGPVIFTNTHSVGLVHDAVTEYRVKTGKPDADDYWWSSPVVGETWDGWLNDINGFHVTKQHLFAALDGAKPGPIEEGSVGGGTGMVCFEFKGGIGTSSRVLSQADGGYTVGVLVQCNCGLRRNLLVAGIPVGKELTEGTFKTAEAGSILILIGTDAPLLPHQLDRLARRAALGLGRVGSYASNGSGDMFVAFSTALPRWNEAKSAATVAMLANDGLSPLFEATAQATEEAIINAMVAAKTMKGIDGHEVLGLPHEALQAILARHGRLRPTAPSAPATAPR